jgi:hypothetical protein
MRFFSQNEQVKRRLVEVAIVARGDLFPNFAAFQEVLLKVQHRNNDHLSLNFAYFFRFSPAESSNSCLKMLLDVLVPMCLFTRLGT